jgi:disulfide oxidoreductase YuzD
MNMEIDLRNVKTICVSLSTATERRERFSSTLNRLGFNNWSFYDAKRGIDVAEGCALSHIDILSNHDFSEPLLLVEDDICESSGYSPILTIPDDADAVYVGYSWWAWDGDRAAQSTLSYPTRSVVENGLYRISSMLSTHAILYLTKEYAMAGVDAMRKHLYDLSGNRHCDVALARIQEKHKVYATPDHLFFQMCPHNTFWTNRAMRTR